MPIINLIIYFVVWSRSFRVFSIQWMKFIALLKVQWSRLRITALYYKSTLIEARNLHDLAFDKMLLSSNFNTGAEYLKLPLQSSFYKPSHIQSVKSYAYFNSVCDYFTVKEFPTYVLISVPKVYVYICLCGLFSFKNLKYWLLVLDNPTRYYLLPVNCHNCNLKFDMSSKCPMRILYQNVLRDAPLVQSAFRWLINQIDEERSKRLECLLGHQQCSNTIEK